MPRRGVVFQTVEQLDSNRRQALDKLITRDAHLKELVAFLLHPPGCQSMHIDFKAFLAEAKFRQEAFRRRWRLERFEVDWESAVYEIPLEAHESVYKDLILGDFSKRTSLIKL